MAIIQAKLQLVHVSIPMSISAVLQKAFVQQKVGIEITGSVVGEDSNETKYKWEI